MQNSDSYRYYDLSYFTSSIIEERNYLETITECIAKDSHCLAPLSFTWQKPAEVTSTTTTHRYCEPMGNGNQFCEDYEQTSTTNFTPFAGKTKLSNDSEGRQFARMFDINADGYSDIIYEDGGWKVLYGPGFTNSPSHLSSIGSSDDAREYALTIDYDGDGKQELLVANDASSNWTVLTYNPHTKTEEVCVRKFDECWTQTYNYTFESVNLNRTAIGFKGAAQVMDVDGDGMQDIVFTSGGQIKMYRNNGLVNGAITFSAATPLTTIASGDALSFNHQNVRNTPSMKNASAIDINGDGRSDLLSKVTTTTTVCEGNGTTRPLPPGENCGDLYGDSRPRTSSSSMFKLFVSDGTLAEPKLTERDSISYSGKDLRVTDLNGDGLSDIVYRQGSNDTWYYRLSNGYDFGAVHQTPFTSPDDAVHEIFFMDLNGDGRADILRPTSKTNWSVMISRPATDADTIIWSHRGSLARDADNSILFGDVNGDAKMDLVTTENNNGWYVNYASRKNIIDHVITDFTNGWGVNTKVTYDNMLSSAVTISNAEGDLLAGDDIADTVFPVGPMAVVKKVESDSNGTGSTGQKVSVTHRYGGLLLHRKGLGSLGFKVLRTTDSQSLIETTTVYSQQYPYIGMPIATVQIAPDGVSVLSETVNTPAQRATTNGGIYPFIDTSTETQYQVGSDGVHRTLGTTVTDSNYDGWGNLSSATVQVKDGATVVHTTSTVNSFGSDDSFEQQKGRLQSTTVTKTPQTGSAVTRTTSFGYYGQSESCNNQTQTRGMLKSSTINGLTTTSCYDVFGHQSKLTKSGKLSAAATISNISSSSIFSADGRVLNSTTNNAGLTTTHKFNNGVATGSVTGRINSSTATDVNGVAVKQHVDIWGKVLAVQTPGASTQTTKMAYCSNCTANSKYYVETKQSGMPTKRVIFDKFGREVAVKIQHFAADTYSYSFKDYDAQGRLLREYVPSFTSTRGTAATDYTQFVYDDFGRVIRLEMPNTSDEGYVHPTTTYAGLVTTKTDANGNATKETRNVQGQLASIEDAKSGTLSYGHDAYGTLKSVTKTADGVSILQVNNTVNSYGQKTKMIDIDKGTWDYRYNGFGQVVWQQDGNNVVTTTDYDGIGRKVRQFAHDFTQCWIYGAAGATNAKGKLIGTRYFDSLGNQSCTGSNYSQATSRDYDSAGRVYHLVETIKDSQSVLNGQYHQYSEFDSNGRLSKQAYPALGLKIRHEY
ncbi:MAG: FG-GAP-like repeat-containing protein, partial [Psychrosphaera sp.]|nr:FG-GAP-like repeat-containing protein [Psychrosphaera sp.]